MSVLVARGKSSSEKVGETGTQVPCLGQGRGRYPGPMYLPPVNRHMPVKTLQYPSTDKIYKQECSPVGCVLPASVVISTGGCLPRGYTSPDLEADAPWTQRQTPPNSEANTPRPTGRPLPLVNRMTDRCENITFLQLRLRTVKMFSCFDSAFVHKIS